MSGDGSKMRFWPMPLTADKVCGVQIAGLYREIKSLCAHPPKVYIEKIFTRPSDTDEGALIVTKDGSAPMMVDLNDRTEVELTPGGDCLRIEYKKGKRDGRVGNLNYAKGAGLLDMVLLWDWPVIHVSPRTWCSVMHKGLPSLPPKEKSRLYISQHWPTLYQKGSDIWPQRMKKPHEGLADALMIAEWGRRYG